MSTKKETKNNKMSGNFQDLLKQIKSSDTYEIEVVRDLISEQIYNVMQVQGIKKAELARKLKTSAPYITKLLQGNGNFTIETLVRIASALGCKFRPMLVPANHEWKLVAEYAKAATFEQNEQKFAKPNNFKASNRVIDIDLDTCGSSTETTNDGQFRQIAD